MQSPSSNSIVKLAASLDQSIRFFRMAQHQVTDPETMEAFRLAADVRALLLSDLRGIANTTPDSATETVAIDYDQLRAHFDARHPERSAIALQHCERLMIALVTQVFRESTSFSVRRLLKHSVGLLQRDARMWGRLALRAQRAA